jgi:hypothetical protein
MGILGKAAKAAANPAKQAVNKLSLQTKGFESNDANNMVKPGAKMNELSSVAKLKVNNITEKVKGSLGGKSKNMADLNSKDQFNLQQKVQSTTKAQQQQSNISKKWDAATNAIISNLKG